MGFFIVFNFYAFRLIILARDIALSMLGICSKSAIYMNAFNQILLQYRIKMENKHFMET